MILQEILGGRVLKKKNLFQGGGKEHFWGLSILSVPFSKTALRIFLFFVLNIDQYTTNHMVSAPLV